MKTENKSEKLIKETLDAYGIPPQWVLGARYDEKNDSVIIVTNGGKKIVHKIGSEIKQKPTMVEISGYLPKEELFWSKKLNQRIKLSDLQKINKN
ncbi:MAG: hypothetical protein BWY69_00809 [Planctomycetes bacterium ADurb.Bin401]|jgi:hypothetical protein|nr:MAG: hypothetical protein BWY69_00809 [Planctomycetes bacterium ADurb.Bin401]HPD57939.1 hypothetical protein [Smithellaceae bacterium]HQQ88326.1 hypothetical protein [Smithellaceae bacterium]